MRRPVLTALATGAALALLLPSPALAECCAPPPPPVESTCPPQRVPTAPFSDLDVTPDPAAVSCLVAYGVVRGTAEGTFDPGRPVTRAQMARFVFRLGEAAGMRWRTDVVRPTFTDLDPASSPEVHEAVSGLVQGGVLQGYDDGTFRGQEPVSRGQAASMLQRYQVHHSSYVRGFWALYPRTEDPFVDDDGSVHERAIGALASTGIAGGTAPGRYAPRSPVTRSAMSRLLVRALAYEQHESDGRTPGDGLVRPWFPAVGDTLSSPESPGPFAPQRLPADGVTPAEWTFAGLDPQREVVLVLAAGENVRRGAGGRLAFVTSRDRPGVADLGEVGAVVTEVHGQPLPVPSRTVRVRPDADGRLVVQATSARDEVVVPVLHRGGPTAELDVEQPVDDPRAQSYAVPALDAVAVSGPAELVAPDAETTDATLTTVVDGQRATADAFSAPGRTGALRRFSYDNQDRLLGEEGTPVGLDAFEFALRPRSDAPEGCDPRRRLEADVVPDGRGPSTFRLLPYGPECQPEVRPAR